MKFGLFYELEVGEAYTERDMWHNALAQSAFAEQIGFDSVYAVEHHFNPGYSHSPCPEIFFAALSQRTKTIRMGTGVQLLPIAHPVRVAERIAAIDILTDGRYDFGVGRGTFWPEFKTFDKPHAQGPTKELNRRLFFECLDIIKKCWTEQEFVYEGEFYQFPAPLRVVPKPVQKPYPRIFAATGSPDSFVLYPKLGMHIMPNTAVQPLDRLAAQLPASNQAWKEGGWDKKLGPLQVNDLVPVHCAETRKKAYEQMEPYEMWYYKKLREFFAPKTEEEKQLFAQQGRTSSTFWETPTFDYIVSERMVICGDPQDCIEQIKEYEQAGVNRLMAQFQVGGMPHKMVMDSMKLFGEEVIPFFQSR